jgi:hypothetical protein
LKPGDDEIVEHNGDEENAVQALFRLASTARLYRSTDGRLHARVSIGDRHEIYWLNSLTFRISANELRRLAPQLALHGLSIRFSRNYEQRLILITRVDAPSGSGPGATETPGKG